MRPRLSVVVPAYNESQRLPPYLDRIRSYLTNSYGGHYELIVVDDGSQDSTPHLMQELSQSWPQLKLVRHTRNRGKGAAVRTGMLAACGDMLLLADADGATPIDQEKKLRRALEAGADIAVGSRLVPGAEVERRRFFHRRWLGRTFALLARVLLHLQVCDTQCGFKMFRRNVAQHLFQLCREPGYLFDLEILVRAQELGYQLAELPVRWADIPGSKVRLVRDGWKMFRGLLKMRRLSDQLKMSNELLLDATVRKGQWTPQRVYDWRPSVPAMSTSLATRS